MRREYWLVLPLTGVLLLLPLGWATFLLLLFIPGFALATLIKERFTPIEMAAIPASLSLALLPAAALAASPLPFHATTTLVAGVTAAIGLHNYRKGRGLSLEGPGAIGLAVAAVAAIIFIVVLLVSLKTFHIAGDGGLYYTFTHGLDQTFHLSIARRYIAVPQIPPQDPYLAGYDIAYNWAMHVTLGEICLASGVGLLGVFKAVVAVASALIFLDAYLLAAALFGPDRKAALGAAALYVASSGLSWLYILYQQYTGIKPDVFNDLVYQWPGIAVLKYDPTSLYYFLPQPQTFGLLAMLLCFYLFILTLRTRSKAVAALTGLAMAAAVFYHLINAFPALATIGLMCLCVALKDRSRPTLLALSIPLAFGGIAVLVQCLTLPANAGSQIAFGRHPDVLITLLVALGPLLPFAAYGAYKLRRDAGARLLAIFALLNLVFVCTLVMEATNDTYRFLTYLSLPVSLFAGCAITGWLTSRNPVKISIAAAVILLMVPSTLVILGFYTYAPEDSLASPMDVNAIQWIRDNTPVDAVVYEAPDHFPRVPILSGRNVVFAGERYMKQYHGVDRQQETDGIMDVTDPAQLHGALASCGANYVLAGGKEMSRPFVSALEDATYFKKVYDRDGFRIYEVLGVPVK